MSSGTFAPDAFPQFFDASYDDFLQYRDAWLTYRNLGHADSNGAWIPPITFIEAQQLPKTMLTVFFGLDSLTAKIQARQQRKDKKGKKPR